jgi:hypothetical protein
MDQQRFDDLARALARTPSRRTFVKGMLGGAVAAIAGRASAVAKEKDKDKPLWKQKCKNPGDCPGGAACVNNHCACPPGSTLCDEGGAFAACVDLLSDHDNCGTCGQGCGENLECLNGTCDCPLPLTHCGEGGCTDTADDPLNCGACGTVCAEGLRCIVGVCACPSGQEPCQGPGGGYNCIDVQNDQYNCGGCGTLCGEGKICQGGGCVCAPDRAACGERCVDLATDPQACGTCGNVCPPGTSCIGGQCGCPDGQANCGGAGCVDRQTDPNNCGFCGHACGPCEECNGGACQPKPRGCCANDETPCTSANGTPVCCPSDAQCCADGCADTALDVNNCGFCGNVCGPCQECVGGACVSTCGPCTECDDVSGACQPTGEEGCACPTDYTTCDDGWGGFTCCASGEQCCNHACIPADEECCEGVHCLEQCCAPDQVCGDEGCCTWCGTTCCPEGQQCCGNTCIPIGKPCCQAGQTACADTCCASGERCYGDPARPETQFCCPGFSCVDTCCGEYPGDGRVTCCTGWIGEQYAGVCCPQGVACNGGPGTLEPSCCAPGESVYQGQCMTPCQACEAQGNICCIHDNGLKSCCDPQGQWPTCTLDGCCAKGDLRPGNHCFGGR